MIKAIEITKMKNQYMVQNYLRSLLEMGYKESALSKNGFILCTGCTKIICYSKEGQEWHEELQSNDLLQFYHLC